MMIFRDIEEVAEWLEPLDYLAFWDAVAPYDLFHMDDRAHCDGLIAGAIARPETVLKGLKAMATDRLASRLGLSFRRYHTAERQGAQSLH